MTAPAPAIPSWSEYLSSFSIFSNAIRLKNTIWTIERYAAPGAKLIEVGCGSGTTAVALSELGYQVTAIDCDRQLIDQTAERYRDWSRPGQLQFQVADMFALPWDAGEFDLAYHQGVLEHFSDELIVRALREQRRIAKCLVFDVPNHRYRGHPYGDERLLSPKYWRGLIEQAGWTVTDQVGRDFRPWFQVLPHFLFSRTALQRCSWFSRHFAVSSIFVCDAGGSKRQ